MNLPNRLTLLRFFLAPLFFVVYQVMNYTGEYIIYLSLLTIIWLYIEVTDLMDGIIARNNGLITDLGKVMDPFADTFSRLTYFVCFTFGGLMPVWVFLIIMYRELLMLFLRLLMIKNGKAVAANVFGKIKSVLYALSAIFTLLYLWMIHLFEFTNRVMYIFNAVLQITYITCAFAALASLLIYMVTIKESKVLERRVRNNND